MPMSLRLDKELEKKITQISKRLNVNKTEIIRRSLNKYLSEIAEIDKNLSHFIYRKLEKSIPGSAHGRLSINHSSEVLKRIKKNKNKYKK
ncbi:MAG: Ribbon-helix-helix protein, copG family [Candidatus Scalindua rubra]|uniref:Ribbon-helix-helix protein, copG family n=1 Tax=Candidatus Scalindua rubra TaxID=1872076 RepID=A0A1E3X9M7_9BACT|nr:MAG: Ribbon-helix-helix protein, copG family [Candidatus Scalindua rubra]